MGRTMSALRLTGSKDHIETRKSIEESSFVKMALSHGLEAIDYMVDTSTSDRATLILTTRGADEAQKLAANSDSLFQEVEGVERVEACRVLVDPRRLT